MEKEKQNQILDIILGLGIGILLGSLITGWFYFPDCWKTSNCEDGWQYPESVEPDYSIKIKLNPNTKNFWDGIDKNGISFTNADENVFVNIDINFNSSTDTNTMIDYGMEIVFIHWEDGRNCWKVPLGYAIYGIPWDEIKLKTDCRMLISKSDSGSINSRYTTVWNLTDKPQSDEGDE